LGTLSSSVSAAAIASSSASSATSLSGIDVALDLQ
jgi:hypothetical protein